MALTTDEAPLLDVPKEEARPNWAGAAFHPETLTDRDLVIPAIDLRVPRKMLDAWIPEIDAMVAELASGRPRYEVKGCAVWSTGGNLYTLAETLRLRLGEAGDDAILKACQGPLSSLGCPEILVDSAIVHYVILAH